jgi:hypothetical protein
MSSTGTRPEARHTLHEASVIWYAINVVELVGAGGMNSLPPPPTLANHRQSTVYLARVCSTVQTVLNVFLPVLPQTHLAETSK